MSKNSMSVPLAVGSAVWSSGSLTSAGSRRKPDGEGRGEQERPHTQQTQPDGASSHADCSSSSSRQLLCVAARQHYWRVARRQTTIGTRSYLSLIRPRTRVNPITRPSEGSARYAPVPAG